MIRIFLTIVTGVIMLKLGVCVGAALTVIVTAAGPVSAQPAGRVKVGTLACQLSPSVGYVVGSRQALTCRFNPETPRPPEAYVGAIKTAGLDIGVKAGGAMLWAVFAPVSGYYRGALAGTYAGVSGDVAIGLGLGANVLVGGSHRSIALQPLSVEGNVGIDVTLGVSRLRLRAAS
jgi:hypothetical protein